MKCLRKPPAARAKCLRALPAHKPTRDVESTLGEEGMAARWVLQRPDVSWFNGVGNTAASWTAAVDADDRPFGDRRRAEALLAQVNAGFGGDLLKALNHYPLVATDTGHLLDGWHRLYLWVKSGLPGGPPTLVLVPGKAGLGAGPKSLTFYRGTVPGATERIQTGNSEWDSYFFVTDTPEGARWYGQSIEVITLKPNAKILYEGTRGFPRGRRGENLLQWASRVAQDAKVRGYDAVHFNHQTDIGTPVLNLDIIESRRPLSGLGGLSGRRKRWAYHGTPAANLPAITKEGLVTSSLYVWFSEFEDSGFFYASSMPDGVVLRFPFPNDASPNPHVLDMPVEDRPRGEYVSEHIIPPDQIQVWDKALNRWKPLASAPLGRGGLRGLSTQTIIAYHGTDAEFDRFAKSKARWGSFGRGFYFTDTTSEAAKYGKRIMRVHLTITRPASLADVNAAAADTAKLTRRGFDGVVHRSSISGLTTYVVFRPEQVEVLPAEGLGKGGLGTAPGNGKLVFRGITKDEHDFIVTHGYIQSNERYCIRGEGTCFAFSYDDAEGYVNYGRTNPIATKSPTYVLAVTSGGDVAVDTRDGYPKVAGHVASDRIKVAYRFNPDGTMERGVWSPTGFSSRSKPKPHPWRKSPAQWGARPGLGDAEARNPREQALSGLGARVPVSEVLAFYAKVSPSQHLADRIKTHPEWDLTRISTAHLKIDQGYDAAKASSYARLKSRPPPIIAVPGDLEWEVLDGNHRAAAALASGKRTISAYVPARSTGPLSVRRASVGLRGLGETPLAQNPREQAYVDFVSAVRHVWKNAEFVLPVVVMLSDEPATHPDGFQPFASVQFNPQGIRAIGSSILRRAPQYTLRVSSRFLALPAEDRQKVLIHEAVHLGYPKHDKEFRDLCREKGGTVSERALDDPGIKAEKKIGSRFQVQRVFTDEKEATRWAKEQQRAEPGSRWRLSLGGVGTQGYYETDRMTMEQKLYGPIQSWKHYPDSDKKGPLLAAYASLTPGEKLALEASVKTAFIREHGGEEAVLYRYKSHLDDPRGKSLTAEKPPTSFKQASFRIRPEQVMVHYGQDEFPLGVGIFKHEKEVILRPDGPVPERLSGVA